MFRADLVAALAYSDGAQGGRPPFDPVMMFKILVIQAAHVMASPYRQIVIKSGTGGRCVLILAESALPDPILASDAVKAWAAGSLDNAMLGPDRNRLAAAKPPNEAHTAGFRHIEKIARRPSERGGEAAPFAERVRYSRRALGLEPGPCVEITRGDRAHGHPFVFLDP
jgi:hypothetical protein